MNGEVLRSMIHTLLQEDRYAISFRVSYPDLLGMDFGEFMTLYDSQVEIIQKMRADGH